MLSKSRFGKKSEDEGPCSQRMNARLTLRKIEMQKTLIEKRNESLSQNVHFRFYNETDNFQIYKEDLKISPEMKAEYEQQQTLTQKLDYLSNKFFSDDIEVKRFAIKTAKVVLIGIKQAEYNNVINEIPQDFINKLFVLLFQSNLQLALLFETASILGILLYISPIYTDTVLNNAPSIFNLMVAHPDLKVKSQLLYLFNNIMSQNQDSYLKLLQAVPEITGYVFNFFNNLPSSSKEIYNVLELVPEMIWAYRNIIENDLNNYIFFNQKVYEDISKFSFFLNNRNDINLYFRVIQFFNCFFLLYFDLYFDQEKVRKFGVDLNKLQKCVNDLKIPQRLVAYFGEPTLDTENINKINDCNILIAQTLIYIFTVDEDILPELIELNLMNKIQNCFIFLQEQNSKQNKYILFLRLFSNILSVADETAISDYYSEILCKNKIIKIITDMYFNKIFASKNTIDVLSEFFYIIFENQKMKEKVIVDLFVWEVPKLFAEILKEYNNYQSNSIERIGRCLYYLFEFSTNFNDDPNALIDYLRSCQIEETLKKIATCNIIEHQNAFGFSEAILQKFFKEN